MTGLTSLLGAAKGDDSIDVIAARARAGGHPIDRGTVGKYLQGKGAKRPPEKVIKALAAGFQIPLREVRQAAGMPPGEPGDWQPTDESALLSQEQRDALDALIKTIVTTPTPHINASNGDNVSTVEQSAEPKAPAPQKSNRLPRTRSGRGRNSLSTPSPDE